MRVLHGLPLRNYWSFFFLALSWVTVGAQDTFFQEGNEISEAKAKELTETYQPDLVMDRQQTLLFEKKIEEFLIREMRIQRTDISLEDKLFLLNQLREQQTAELANILTRPQLRRYMKVNNRIQPVAVVVDTVKSENRK